MSRADVRKIVTRFKALGDEEKARFAAGFFKTGPGEYGEGDVFLGIRVPVLRKLAGEYADITTADTTELLQSRYHETRLLALLIMVRKFERGDAADRKHIYTEYLANTHRVNNWDLVDSSAHHIVGGFLENRSRRPLYRLARSSSLWERRIAMIATYYYIRNRDFDDALAIAEILVADEHDLIHKAVGWMLREVGNRDRAAEEAFLRRHYRDMPRTMLRYAIEKFPERLRKRYLAGTVPTG